MFTLKGGICTNKGGNSKFIFARIMALFGLKFFGEFLGFFLIPPNITKPMYFGFKNSILTRGHTFKIKSSYS